jgi:hypothetical protein
MAHPDMHRGARRTVLRVVFAVLAGVQGSANAAGPGGCDAFDWPLATELAWMVAADPLDAVSGGTVASLPEKAIALSLQPEAQTKLAVPASGKPKSVPDRPFAGTVTVASLAKGGVYQVTLSGPGWIDVIQDGQVAGSVSHTGKADCPSIRKSVRFELKPGPVTLQVTSVPAESIRITIRPAD